MPYYFSGSYNQEVKIKLNVDQLFSMYHEEKLITKTILYKREHPEYTAKLMLDSGAFTHYQQAKKKGHLFSRKFDENIDSDIIKKVVNNNLSS